MATLVGQIQNEDQIHEVEYTGVRIRFQRSTDAGATWADVQSNVRALGTAQDSYDVPVGANGQYRMGAALTDGIVFGTELFSDVKTLALIQTPVTLILTVTA